MHDTTERIRRVKLRVEELRCREEKRLIGSLFSLCVILVGIIGNMAGGGQRIATGLYGSMLMYENVGSHVLVGVISFSAAIGITVMCIRNKEKNKKILNSKKDE
ncbi:MAG: hypothetical protein PHV12_03485 [Bacteroidales bacterium]|nr:hypothetical protein [Bacteroidales bacterium]